MPRPTTSTAASRPELGMLAYEYQSESSRRGFIAHRVMPVFEVVEQSAEYPIIPLESLLKVPKTKRAARAAYARGDWEFETGNYSCQEHGWEEPVDDVEAALYRRYFEAEQVSNEIATDHISRSHEKRVADKMMNTANAIGTSSVAIEWSKAATATPRSDVKAGVQAMRAASGLTPNAVVMSLTVFENVMNTKEIKDYLQYTSPHLTQGTEAQRDTLARYFGVAEVLVGGGVEDMAKKGKSFVIGDLWSKEYVSLVRLSDGSRRLREPVFGRTFLWTGDSPNMLVSESYRDESIRSNIIRVRHNVDESIIFKGANYLLSNITE